VSDTERLSITGYQGQPVAMRLRRRTHEGAHLAVLLRGLGYRSTMPALYYCSQMMYSRGADVLSMEYRYDILLEFVNGSDEEKLSWIKADAGAAFDAITSSQFGRYRRFTVIGKSLGTVGMALIIPEQPKLSGADLIWLTPSFSAPGFSEGFQRCCDNHHRSIVVIGTADPGYDETLLHDLRIVSA
jgi:hypothetical protein